VLRPNTRKGLNRLLAAIRAQEPARVVVGLPLSLSGRDSAQTAEARAFAEHLGARHALEGLGVEIGDEPRADQADAQFGHAHSPPVEVRAELEDGRRSDARKR
jgi:putative Holliday junction resolvase